MPWNTALDGNGTTYYWNEKGESTYEKPSDFNEATAQAAGSYSQYAGRGQSNGGSNGYSNGGGGGYGGGGGGYDPYAHIGLQYSQPVNNNYKDVQDGGADKPDCDATAAFWAKNDVKVYGRAPPPFLTFQAAALPGPIMGAIAQAGFDAPSVIQAQTWPAAMAQRDVIGVAKTGSGKTLGFLVPGFLNVLASRVDPRQGPSILVHAPTRDLAMQIEFRERAAPCMHAHPSSHPNSSLLSPHTRALPPSLLSGRGAKVRPAPRHPLRLLLRRLTQGPAAHANAPGLPVRHRHARPRQRLPRGRADAARAGDVPRHGRGR